MIGAGGEKTVQSGRRGKKEEFPLLSGGTRGGKVNERRTGRSRALTCKLRTCENRSRVSAHRTQRQSRTDTVEIVVVGRTRTTTVRKKKGNKERTEGTLALVAYFRKVGGTRILNA